jgi:hypothetical protein
VAVEIRLAPWREDFTSSCRLLLAGGRSGNCRKRAALLPLSIIVIIILYRYRWRWRDEGTGRE